MIKIIKDGQKDFIAKCPTCGCEFSYQLIDINLGSVMCPYCGRYVGHKGFDEPFITDQTIFPYNLIQPKTEGDIISNVVLTSSDNASRLNLKQSTTCAPTELQTIHDLCVDYDGFNTVEGLKSLIGDIRAITEETLK